MPIYRCPACGFVAEDSAAPGSKLPCGKCGAPSTLFATPFYVQKLVERYQASRRELDALKLAVASTDEEESPPPTEHQPSAGSLRLDELNNTDLLATETQHQPLHDWFRARQIAATFTLDAVDTTGFFDEAAREIGDGYDLLEGLLEQIRFAYRKEYSWLNADLSKHDPAA